MVLVVFTFMYLLAVNAICAHSRSIPRVTIREPYVKLTTNTRFNFSSGVKLPDLDRARAMAAIQSLQASQKKKPGFSVPLVNAVAISTAEVGIGNPPTNYSLIVDTGSSNTWIGAEKPYVRTQSSIFTGDFMRMIYGSGYVFGEEFLDQVTLGPDLVIRNQSIGAAIFSSRLSGTDGILGIGPTNLTLSSLSRPDNGTTIPTVTDNLYKQGSISHPYIGISLEPTTSLDTTNGEITFGSADHTKFTGKIHYSPITSTAPSNSFWGIDQSVTYGTDTPLLNLTSGVVDTGTTLLLLASDAISTYQSATGAVLDDTTGLLTITKDQLSNLKSMFFHINGVEFEFTPNAQLFPRALNTAIGGQADNIYLIVSDIGSIGGAGLDFVNGFSFLQRFYSVYDSANSRVGLATTLFTNATTN